MSKVSSYLPGKTVGNSENVTVHQGKRAKTDVSGSAITKPRQTLGTLQPATDRALTRKDEKNSKGKKINSKSGILKVFEDPKGKLSLNKVDVTVDEEVQTDVSGAACPHCVASSTPIKERSAEQEAYELMVQDDPPAEYWKALAEERRSALDESLKENEQLHTEVETLLEENARLTDLAKDAEYFAEMFKSMVGEGITTPSDELTANSEDEPASQ